LPSWDQVGPTAEPLVGIRVIGDIDDYPLQAGIHDLAETSLRPLGDQPAMGSQFPRRRLSRRGAEALPYYFRDECADYYTRMWTFGYAIPRLFIARGTVKASTFLLDINAVGSAPYRELTFHSAS
jgi:hypothetical protein